MDHTAAAAAFIADGADFVTGFVAWAGDDDEAREYRAQIVAGDLDEIVRELVYSARVGAADGYSEPGFSAAYRALVTEHSAALIEALPNDSVGAQVRAARKSAGLTAPQLAEALGVSANTVLRWERGELAVSTDRLEAIATATGATLRITLTDR